MGGRYPTEQYAFECRQGMHRKEPDTCKNCGKPIESFRTAGIVWIHVGRSIGAAWCDPEAQQAGPRAEP
jgi:hypothetical protein